MSARSHKSREMLASSTVVVVPKGRQSTEKEQFVSAVQVLVCQ
jgi:hypothetical protein